MRPELNLITNDKLDNLIVLTEFIGRDDFSKVVVQTSDRKEKVTTFTLSEYASPILSRMEETLDPSPTLVEKKILLFNYMVTLMEKVRYKTLILTNTKGEKLDVVKLYA